MRKTKNKTKSKNDFAAGAIESAKPIPDSPNLLLLEGQNFVNCPLVLTRCAEAGEYDDLWLRNRLPTGIRFYYYLEQYSGSLRAGDDATVYAEQGVGYTEEDGDYLIFVRETPLMSGKNRPSLTRCSSNVAPEPLSVEFSASVTSIIPPSYQFALASPHCVISSVDAFVPTPVELEENSLLGRKDNRVQSIDKDELLEILTTDAIIETVTTNNHQMALSSRRVNLTHEDSVVSAPIIRPYPPYKDNKKPKTQKGAIIYNESTDCLEYYTGKEWRVLAWESDNE